jgi:predicted NBD/HSP70 family sugar kinase
MASDTWHVSGRFLSCDLTSSIRDLARAVFNLVNVQGPGAISISPPSLEAVGKELDNLDPSGSWRSWWLSAAGESLTLVDRENDTVPIAYLAQPTSLAHTGRCLGLNVGGHYLRLVWLNAGVVVDATTIRLGTGERSVLSNGTLDSFVELLHRECSLKDMSAIGIAWSAPRTSLGLRAMSILMENARELGELVHSQRIDNELTEKLDVPVASWNDGEAVVAAEYFFGAPRSRPLLALKLGTSMASGIATSAGVCSLPMQLAKCLPEAEPHRKYSHPQTGTRGTVRDMVGADPLVRTYRSLSGDNVATYEDFCAAAVAGAPIATDLVNSATVAIAELVNFVSALWSPVDVVVTGKNLEQEDFEQLFAAGLKRRLCSNTYPVSLLKPACDPNLVAAIGAVCLTVGRFERTNCCSKEDTNEQIRC